MYKQIIFPLALMLFSGIAHAALPPAGLFIVPEVARHAAPDFVSENLQGSKTALADYRGKLVLLNFWAMWCMPCRVWKNCGRNTETRVLPSLPYQMTKDPASESKRSQDYLI